MSMLLGITYGGRTRIFLIENQVPCQFGQGDVVGDQGIAPRIFGI